MYIYSNSNRGYKNGITFTYAAAHSKVQKFSNVCFYALTQLTSMANMQHNNYSILLSVIDKEYSCVADFKSVHSKCM